MKVSELIAELQKHDPNKEVMAEANWIPNNKNFMSTHSVNSRYHYRPIRKGERQQSGAKGQKRDTVIAILVGEL